MQENPAGRNMPVYASLSTMRQEPSQEEMNNGVIPLDTLPATWWNWMWNAITQAQNDSMYNDDVLFTEINNVLAAAGITPGTSQQHDQLRQAIMVIKDTIATTAAAGSVLSTDGGTTGTVKVGADGKMTVNNFGDIALFHGASKSNLMDAVNETYDIAFDNKDNAGELATLTTTAKTTLVDAINETYDIAFDNKDNAGELDTLTTIERNTLVGAINELDAGKAPKAHASTEAIYGIGSATNYGHVKLTDTPSSDDASSGTAATPKLVQDMVSGGVGTVSAVTYTYVVDSDIKLQDWANNVKTGGQDYTYVLIRRGTYTSEVGVDLEVTGTKVVVGEPGSMLYFNKVGVGIGYDALTKTDYSDEYYMRDVNVTVRHLTGGALNITGFKACRNLINCRAYVKGQYYASGFRLCRNLINCIGEAECSSSTSSAGYGYGFNFCTYMINCLGIGIGNGTPGSSGHGVGVYNGNGVIGCTGIGTSTNEGNGYGFQYSKGVIMCRRGEAVCKTRVFETCYASSSGNSSYSCADTPNGGFNILTN